ncbi:hypothetical protein HNP12_002264 [Aeromonas hydrophila]|uniref:AAA domain-containing protein n=1 Tax=Aeromonas hydrophila TaxID=644 RepID=UPI002169E791|nr:AAA domain-containing protein [Aeromonas hydrophila]MCS3768193.1 hypothetical protein [Aeromonas hydrophila]MCS3792570.1 hypothetical protein [Aeromonas hydrophila]
MQPTSLSYAAYWRDSLADAELNRGGLSQKDLLNYHKLPFNQIQEGQLAPDITLALFHDEADDMESVVVELRLQVYLYRLTHGKRTATGCPEVVTPLVTVATLDREGILYPHGLALVPRDILEPLAQGSFSVGRIEMLDEWLTQHPAPFIDRKSDTHETHNWSANNWQLLVASYFDKMIAKVTDNWPDEQTSYLKADYGLLHKRSTQSGANRHILPLYDHLVKTRPSNALFERYAREQQLPLQPCLGTFAGVSQRLGHASDRYPLADAQRAAMTHHLLSQQGDILAVNGPPGTGKTTLLLSIIASHMVESAIAADQPRLIAATSTNNQAVTNILDAFAKDFSVGTGPFAGRWLPDVHSFGSYFPAAHKRLDASAQYQTMNFFDSIENSSYVSRAREVYLHAAQQAYPDLADARVSEVTDRLHKDLVAYADMLCSIDSSWKLMSQAKDAVTWLGEAPYQALANLRLDAHQANEAVAFARAAKLAWEMILTEEPWWQTLFSWLPAVANRRFITARRALRATTATIPDECNSIEALTAALDRELDNALITYKIRQQRVVDGETALTLCETTRRQWCQAIAPVVSIQQSDTVPSLEEVDKLADTGIRFQAFLLATHYWEGRWLQTMEEQLNQLPKEQGKTGKNAVTARWMRRMMLTPCMVSTFYMLPSEMKVSRYEQGDFIPDYLYEFIDLLIVDEAGQVSPEVAGASFALAKKALVIGDTQQIAPIWNMPPSIDIGNLHFHRLLDIHSADTDYDRLCKAGKTASKGSVMRIAQCASRYHYDPALERGMTLYEHRRCVDEIINYCNELCYHGKLLPKRGVAVPNTAFPAMGYLHIDGKCLRIHGGSRHNLLEAETIAAWLREHRQQIETLYGADLGQVVAVVTPFAGQVEAISTACKKRGLPVGKNKNGITIGTTHALQGAERPIVLFSPTYSKHADGLFIDNSNSMLNVAVSRAKDHFLVFGDMDLFNQERDNTPRGLLAKHLFSRPENMLKFQTMRRHDLAPTEAQCDLLRDVHEHNAFLLEVLASATQEVHIVSPWLRKHRIVQAGLLPAMEKASARGVTVTVYADPALNMKDEDHWLPSSTALQEAGINLIKVPRLHSKMVAKDGKILCLGSFNWLSAANHGPYARHETSIAYSGPAVHQEIRVLVASLVTRQ